MSLTSAATKTGKGLLNATNFIVTAAHDGPIKEKIETIDKTIEMLQKDRARLVDELIDATDI
jgi:hypothetical protein